MRDQSQNVQDMELASLSAQPEDLKDPTSSAPKSPPESCTVTWINFTGLLALLVASAFARDLSVSIQTTLLLVLAAPAVTIITLEALFIPKWIPFRPLNATGYIPKSTGASPSDRVVLKIIGLSCSVGVVALCYSVFPIYRNGGAVHLIDLVSTFWIPLVIGAPIYIWFVDGKMAQPEDSYFHIGLLATGKLERVDWDVIKQHALQWTVKGFFLPLMLVFCVEKVDWMNQRSVAANFLAFVQHPTTAGWYQLYEFLYVLFMYIDVTFASIGYILTLKIFDAHLRSAEPTGFGWIVCLACYPPFWNTVGGSYFDYANGGMPWGLWLEHWPLLKLFWSIVILALYLLYAMSTVQFGIRFSNLTHRGILTNGPYRWLKHPAYISKNLAWWFYSVPFLSTMGPADGIRASLLLLGVNAIYFLRARTEERHLANDPVYREYLAFMRNNDLFAVCKRRFALVWGAIQGRRSQPTAAAREI